MEASEPEPPRVRLLDIALKAKVSVMTVSKALRNHPDLAVATGERIRKLAQTMGYEPDPSMSALASYRTAKRVARVHATIGLVAGGFNDRAWLKEPFSGEVFATLRGHAASLGYAVDLFDVTDYRKKPGRLGNVLENRGIRGVLLNCPAAVVESLQWESRRFSVVALGAEAFNRHYHKATVNQIDIVRGLFLELSARGYRRPGFTVVPNTDAFDDGAWTWALRSLQASMRESLDIPIHPAPSDLSSLLEWINKYRPDVVVYVGAGWLRQSLERAGMKLPRDLGLCCLDLLSANDFGASGFWQRREDLAIAALNNVHGMLLRNERGAPVNPLLLSLPGRWVEGGTLRPRQTFGVL